MNRIALLVTLLVLGAFACERTSGTAPPEPAPPDAPMLVTEAGERYVPQDLPPLGTGRALSPAAFACSGSACGDFLFSSDRADFESDLGPAPVALSEFDASDHAPGAFDAMPACFPPDFPLTSSTVDGVCLSDGQIPPGLEFHNEGQDNGPLLLSPAFTAGVPDHGLGPNCITVECNLVLRFPEGTCAAGVQFFALFDNDYAALFDIDLLDAGGNVLATVAADANGFFPDRFLGIVHDDPVLHGIRFRSDRITPDPQDAEFVEEVAFGCSPGSKPGPPFSPPGPPFSPPGPPPSPPGQP